MSSGKISLVSLAMYALGTVILFFFHISILANICMCIAFALAFSIHDCVDFIENHPGEKLFLNRSYPLRNRLTQYIVGFVSLLFFAVICMFFFGNLFSWFYLAAIAGYWIASKKFPTAGRKLSGNEAD